MKTIFAMIRCSILKLLLAITAKVVYASVSIENDNLIFTCTFGWNSETYTTSFDGYRDYCGVDCECLV